MAAPEIIHLRETPSAAPHGARIIDAKFRVVGARRRTIWSRLGAALLAVALAALAGALFPPLVMLASAVFGNA